MDFPIYTTRELYGVMYDLRQEAPSRYWLDLLFPGSHMSDREEIIFEKITSKRRIAPFVLPTVPGKPTWTRDGSAISMFKPAYIKPKDAVRPTDMISRQPGDLFTQVARTPKANFDREVIRITQFHRSIIERRWEWLAAKAAIDGQVTISGEGYPTQVIDFGRAGNQTVVKSGGGVWTDTYDILGDIQDWSDRMASAAFGGLPNRITMGSDVWKIVRKNAGVLKQLDTQVRGDTETLIRTGIIKSTTLPDGVRWVGRLGGDIDLYLYSDYYVDNTGAQVPFLGSKELVMSGPGVDGVKAFGAIQDIAANLNVVDIFSKMFDENDPSARFILSQSAPLMIPVNPNCTLKATVLE